MSSKKQGVFQKLQSTITGVGTDADPDAVDRLLAEQSTLLDDTIDSSADTSQAKPWSTIPLPSEPGPDDHTLALSMQEPPSSPPPSNSDDGDNGNGDGNSSNDDEIEIAFDEPETEEEPTKLATLVRLKQPVPAEETETTEIDPALLAEAKNYSPPKVEEGEEEEKKRWKIRFPQFGGFTWLGICTIGFLVALVLIALGTRETQKAPVDRPVSFGTLAPTPSPSPSPSPEASPAAEEETPALKRAKDKAKPSSDTASDPEIVPEATSTAKGFDDNNGLFWWFWDPKKKETVEVAEFHSLDLEDDYIPIFFHDGKENSKPLIKALTCDDICKALGKKISCCTESCSNKEPKGFWSMDSYQNWPQK